MSAVNTFGADGLLSRSAGGSSVFYTFDPSGNVSQRLDGGGAVLSSDRYDAFGQGQTTASVPDVFGFGGQWGYYTDRETGLVLCTHRYYDPAAGRFLTRDPIGYGGGLNLYAYTANDPVNRSDPSGLQSAEPPSEPPAEPARGNIEIDPSDGEAFAAGVGAIGRGIADAAGSAAQAAEDAIDPEPPIPTPGSGLLWPLTPFPPEQDPNSRLLDPGVEPGEYCYATDPDGNTNIVGNGEHVHPTIFGGGRPVIGAGTIIIGSDGTVTEITNYSGTFQPSPGSMGGVINSISNQGMPVNSGTVVKTIGDWGR